MNVRSLRRLFSPPFLLLIAMSSHAWQPDEQDHLILNVNGMHCQSCVSMIRKTVRKVPGVESVSVDLGKGMVEVKCDSDFTKGFRSVVVTFEPSATKEQVEGTMAIIAKLYPGEWGSVEVAPDRLPIMWEVKEHNGHAKLGDGKAEVKLAGFVGNDGKSLVKISNLTYWGSQKNDGFVFAKGTHHYRGEGLDYSFEDSNGFFIDIESSGS